MAADIDFSINKMAKINIILFPVNIIPLGLKQQLPELASSLAGRIWDNFFLSGQFLLPHFKAFLHSVSDLQIPSPISHGWFVVQLFMTKVSTVPIH